MPIFIFFRGNNMQSSQIINEKLKTNNEEETQAFDLGPLWSLNSDLTLDDFKNCVISEKSIDYLITTIKRNQWQRFAIYGKVKKQEGDKPSVFYVFFQPSIYVAATKEKCLRTPM